MRPPSSVTSASEYGRDVSRCNTVVVRAPEHATYHVAITLSEDNLTSLSNLKARVQHLRHGSPVIPGCRHGVHNISKDDRLSRL